MRKTKIKKIKKKPTEELTQHRIGLLKALLLVLDKRIDSQIPPLTNESKDKIYIKPEWIDGQRVYHTSELTKRDKEGKEYPFEIDEGKAHNVFYSPPGKSPYTTDFTRLEFWQSVLGVSNDEETRFLKHNILDKLKQRQIARKEDMSQQRVSQKYQKLWSKLQYHPYITHLLMRTMGGKRFAKFLGKFIVEKQSGRGSKG